MSEGKPSDTLTPDDFQRHPLWGYAADLDEENPEVDETWVVPVEVDETPRDSDTLFVGAKIRTAGGDILRGAILFAFEAGRPVIGALALLEPGWFSFGIEKGRVTEEEREEVEERLPQALPLAYEGAVPVGSGELRLSGSVT